MRIDEISADSPFVEGEKGEKGEKGNAPKLDAGKAEGRSSSEEG